MRRFSFQVTNFGAPDSNETQVRSRGRPVLMSSQQQMRYAKERGCQGARTTEFAPGVHQFLTEFLEVVSRAWVDLGRLRTLGADHGLG